MTDRRRQQAQWNRAKRRKKLRRQRQIVMRLVLVLFIILVIVLLVVGISNVRESIKYKQEVQQQIEQAEQESADAALFEETNQRDLTFTFTGDITLGKDDFAAYDPSMVAYYDQNGPDYFLENVRSVFEADECTVINMESVLTDLTVRVDKEFAFRADPEYVRILTGSSVEAANMANNHSHDYGEQSFTDTKELLEENDITTFGYDQTAIREVNGVKVGFSGINALLGYDAASEQLTENFNTLRENGAEVLIAIFHWGIELSSCPTSEQVTLAHQAVDEGAAVVIGHHPHVLQGIEYYNGVTICYSLGNFCFGGNAHPTEPETMIFQMKMHLNANREITETTDTVTPCLVSTTTEYNTYQPTIQTGTEGDRILTIISDRSAEIKENYPEVQAVYEKE